MFSKEIIRTINTIREQAPLLDFSVRDIFIDNLIYIYQVMLTSESLLLEASKMVDGELKEYYLRHAKEEKNHDKWMARDLLSEGIDVTKLEVTTYTLELAGPQYYFIKHVDPRSLLGYMAVIEGNPIPLDFLQ